MHALILSGGQSQRMGQPKALLSYHHQPQIFHLAELLAPLCEAVCLSCKPGQQSLFTEAGWQLPVIIDDPAWSDIGPLSGLLSAFQFRQTAWLVVGCDYPFLTAGDFQTLFVQRDPDCLATVFRHPETGVAEPLIGIYELTAGEALLEWAGEGNQSLRWFLEHSVTKFVTPDFGDHLRSVDTYEDYLQNKSV